MLTSLIAWFKAWYLGALKTFGYPLVALLMAIESSFLPVPSEVIIPPAAHWAHNTHEVHLALAGIVLAGTIGSWIGATLTYWLARIAGRPLILRFGRFVLFPPEKLEKAEGWSAHYGAAGVFIARLLPGARQLVAIPAGITRMDYKLFSLFTLLGAAIWCSVLCWVGIKMGQDEQLMRGELHRVTLWFGSAVVVLGGLYYFFVHRHLKKKVN